MSKDTKGRGCGIYPIIFGGWPKKYCDWHDDAYTTGSSQQFFCSRKEVDRTFLTQMLEGAKTGRLRPLKKMSAYAMYGIVRAVGWVWWEK